MSSAAGAAPFAPGLAVGAEGILAAFNRSGVLSPADVHVAARLAGLVGESREDVQLAVALAVRAVRHGSVCVDLARVRRTVTVDRDDPAAVPFATPADDLDALPWPDAAGWAARCVGPLVADAAALAARRRAGEQTELPIGVVGEAPSGAVALPVVRDGDLLYLDRYWQDECLVAAALDTRLRREVPVPWEPGTAHAALDAVFGRDPDDAQRRAAEVVLRCGLTVLTGGPGTGKTTTVNRVLEVLRACSATPLRVSLAAPTGKAAARLHPDAVTLHRLLGSRPGAAGRFRHGSDNHLPADVVVVDETSMVPLSLMARLLEAVRPDARLLLVGDPDQLASVEAGAVLRDVVDRPAPADARGEHVVRLRRVHRSVPAVRALAEAIRAGDADAALSALDRRDAAGPVPAEGAALLETDTGAGAGRGPADAVLTPVLAVVRDQGLALRAAAGAGDVAAALDALGRHQLLCGRRSGPAGTRRWAELVQQWAVGAAPGAPAGRWEPGAPLIVTRNSYETGLFNGDTGVVVVVDGAVTAAFPAAGARGGARVVHPSRVADLESARALTVHKAQGSEFDAVTVVLPEAGSPVLTRELLYTAVTRARRRVWLVGTAAAVTEAVNRPVQRASGLRGR